MRKTAAKGRRLLLLVAVLALAGAFLISIPAEASRNYSPPLTAALEPDLLKPSFDLADAEDADAAGERFALFTTDDLSLLAALALFDASELDAINAENRIRLFGDSSRLPRPVQAAVARKTASGVFDCGRVINIMKTGGLSEKCVGPSFQGLWTDPTTGLSYARNRWYDARTASWLSEDPLGAVDSPNLYAFVRWAPHMYADPMGEEVYLVYRQFNGDVLKHGFQAIGHFYLVFDEKDLPDVQGWRDLVSTIGGQFDPSRFEAPDSETFSFHPWEAREVTDPQTGLPLTSPPTKDKSHSLLVTAYTRGSYIGYNDAVDQESFLKWRDGGQFSAALDAIAWDLDMTQEQQEVLYRLAIESRNINNASAESNDMGWYRLNHNNCGTWSRWMLDRVGADYPEEALFYNVGGVAIDGPIDQTLIPQQLTAGAAIVGEGRRAGEVLFDEVGKLMSTPAAPQDGNIVCFWGVVTVKNGRPVAVNGQPYGQGTTP